MSIWHTKYSNPHKHIILVNPYFTDEETGVQRKKEKLAKGHSL